MTDGIVARGLKKVRSLVGGEDHPLRMSERQRVQLRQQLRECAEGLGGEVSARVRAAKLGETYLRLDDEGRHEFLRLIATEFGPDPKAIEKAHLAYQKAIGTPAQWDAEAVLRRAVRSSRIRILTQFNALPQGVKFLVDLRADLLRYLDADKDLAALDRELETRLTAWFDVGFLEVHRITWNSPAALLEKLIQYEAVHEIRSWDDLKNRLDSRSPPLRLLPSAHAHGTADLRRGGPHRSSGRQRPGAPRCECPGLRSPEGRHGDFLFHLQHPERPARRFLRQLPAQAGG